MGTGTDKWSEAVCRWHFHPDKAQTGRYQLIYTRPRPTSRVNPVATDTKSGLVLSNPTEWSPLTVAPPLSLAPKQRLVSKFMEIRSLASMRKKINLPSPKRIHGFTAPSAPGFSGVLVLDFLGCSTVTFTIKGNGCTIGWRKGGSVDHDKSIALRIMGPANGGV